GGSCRGGLALPTVCRRRPWVEKDTNALDIPHETHGVLGASERSRRTHLTTDRSLHLAGAGAMNARPLPNSEPFPRMRPWAGPFRNGGNDARATACRSLSPFRNGGNGEHAMPCQRMSPFRNGGNGPSAIPCPVLSPFRNGGNGERVMLCLLLPPFMNGGNGPSATW